MTNEEIELAIKKIVDENPIRYTKILSNEKNVSLKRYIEKNTPLLADEKYSFRQKVEWIIRKRTEFPRCQNLKCNKILDDPCKFIGINQGYRSHCCQSCSTADEQTVKKHMHTCLQLYGEYHHNTEKDFKTRQERYGDSHYNNRRKAKDTCIKRYGVSSPAQNKSTIDKILEARRKTCLKKYGNENYLGSEAFKMKCNELYGANSPSQSRDIFLKQRQKYSYDNIKFDSRVEIAFYVWLRDNHIHFIFQPEKHFEYAFNGKVHWFFPDFEVEGCYIELKGDHFFKEDGTMCNPYDHSQDALYEAKRQCMLKNNVKIMKASECKKYIDYVNKKHGRDFLKNCKISSSKTNLESK